jgi:hypothetical protein
MSPVAPTQKFSTIIQRSSSTPLPSNNEEDKLDNHDLYQRKVPPPTISPLLKKDFIYRTITINGITSVVLLGNSFPTPPPAAPQAQAQTQEPKPQIPGIPTGTIVGIVVGCKFPSQYHLFINPFPNIYPFINSQVN